MNQYSELLQPCTTHCDKRHHTMNEWVTIDGDKKMCLIYICNYELDYVWYSRIYIGNWQLWIRLWYSRIYIGDYELDYVWYSRIYIGNCQWIRLWYPRICIGDYELDYNIQGSNLEIGNYELEYDIPGSALAIMN